jgi:hypothetical protein
MTTTQLEAIGGKSWSKNGVTRVYFNDLCGLFGLTTYLYGTGNISSATLNGAAISNTQAKKIENQFIGCKLYYDIATQKFVGQGLSQSELNMIAARIEKLATPPIPEATPMTLAADFTARVQATSSLDELCDTLNTLESALPEGVKLEELIDTTSLPTFGGADIADEGIFSWDNTHALYSGNKWHVLSREHFLAEKGQTR